MEHPFVHLDLAAPPALLAQPSGARAAPAGAGLVPSINKVKTNTFKTDVCFTVPLRESPETTLTGKTIHAVAFVSIRIGSPQPRSRADVIDALEGALARARFEGFDK
jgi:hypothetical protein